MPDQDGTCLDPGYCNISGIATNLDIGAYEYICTLSLDALPETLYITEYD